MIQPNNSDKLSESIVMNLGGGECEEGGGGGGGAGGEGKVVKEQGSKGEESKEEKGKEQGKKRGRPGGVRSEAERLT